MAGTPPFWRKIYYLSPLRGNANKTFLIPFIFLTFFLRVKDSNPVAQLVPKTRNPEYIGLRFSGLERYNDRDEHAAERLIIKVP